jgi:hypothetical protein
MFSGSRSRWQKGISSTTFVVGAAFTGLFGVRGVCGPGSAIGPGEVGDNVAHDGRRSVAKKEPTCRLWPHPATAECCSILNRRARYRSDVALYRQWSADRGIAGPLAVLGGNTAMRLEGSEPSAISSKSPVGARSMPMRRAPESSSAEHPRPFQR